jgi:tripartite-type tricarboxylate transporter receptor subunit TctC
LSKQGVGNLIASNPRSEIVMACIQAIQAVRAALISSLVALLVGPLHAQSTTTIVVPYPAGGVSDYVARTIQPELSRQLGETILIDNVGGVGGTLGIQRTLAAAADGHTLVLASPNELILTPMVLQAARHKAEGMRPVAFLTSAPLVLLARKDLPADSFDALLALAHKPGARELSYGSVGIGSLYHLVAEALGQRAGIKLLHVPYKGASPLLADLMGGQIDIAFLPLGGNVPALIKEDKIKAFGVTAGQPAAQMPELPVLVKTKGFETFQFEIWSGLFVARNTSQATVDKLNQAVNAGLRASEYRKTFEARGTMVFSPMTPDALNRLYANEIARYQALARSINVQPQ